jgi:hypothetical protein
MLPAVGTDLTDVDKLLLHWFQESWVSDGEPSDQAQQHRRELPPGLRPQVPANDRDAHCEEQLKNVDFGR